MSATVLNLFFDIIDAEGGTREEPLGSNSGRKVREYQDADNLPGTGYYWCASYVVWGAKKLLKELNAALKFPASASCDEIYRYARRRKLVFSTPKPGDIFFVIPDPVNDPNNATHTGFVREVKGNKFRANEGNSNDEGSRNGYEVATENWRKVTSRFVFFRWMNELSKVDLNTSNVMDVVVGGKTLENLEVVGGQPMVPVREWFKEYLGLDDKKLAFDKESNTLSYNKRVISAPVTVRRGQGFVPLNALVKFSALRTKFADDGSKVVVSRLMAKKPALAKAR